MLPHRIKAKKAYMKTIKGKAVKKKSDKKHKKKYPIKYAAITILNNAIKSGRIKRKPCEICGSTKNIQGHHDDYAFPLSVKWLCPKHHTELHKKINQGEINVNKIRIQV